MSGKPAARKNDPHPEGPILDGSPNVFINKRPSARMGDPVRHGKGIEGIAQGSLSVLTNGQPTSRKDDLVDCIDPIIEGSPNVFIGAPTGVACSICPHGVTEGNPVNPMLGAKVLPSETDVFLPGPLPFVVSRDYSSYQTGTPAPVGLLGPGWWLPGETTLVQSGELLTLNDAKGRSIRFFDVLAPGQITYSRSEGLWIVRGGIDQLPADSPLALAWQSIPSAWREHPGLFFVTNAALGPWWVHGPDGAGALLDGQSKASSVPSDIEGQRLRLQALADRFGRMQRYSRSPDKPWQHAITGVQDGAGRRYRLELIKLPHAVSAQGRQGWGADSGIRLAAVYLQSDPGHSARRKPLARYEYTPQGELAAVHGRDGSLLRRFEYHPTLLGRMSAHAYPGRPNASSYVYDDSGKVIAQNNPGALSYRFDYQKDSTVVTDSLGRSKTLHFEGKEGLRRVVRIERSDGSAIENKYDGNGNLICATDALGRQTYYSVDVNTGQIDTIASSDGQRTDLYYDRHGNVTDVRGLDGVRETRQYDPLGRLTRQTDALGQNTHYRYGDNHSEQPSEIEDARGGVKRLSYNSAGQLASYTDCSGSTAHYRYDRWGQLIEIRGEEGLSRKSKYDPLGRLIAQTDAAGQKTAYRLNQAGDLMGVSAPDGSQVTFERDERGQITAFNQGGLSQRYQYDPAGRLTMLVNENAAQTVFKYDVMDRLIEQINFDGRAQRYQYDIGGQLIESEDAGQQSAYEYDKAGRLIKRQSNQSDGSQYQERYEYDNEGQLIRVQSGTVSTDKTATEGHNATRVEFKRDRLGRVTQETQSMVNAAGATLWRHQVKHQYDVLGNEAGTGLHNLPLLNWQTYGSGHLHGITLDNETLIDFERDKLHREVERGFAGTKVLRKYDSLSRLAGVRGLSQDMHIGRAINRDLHYDAVGQLTQIDTLKGTHQYRYDAARRLIGAQLPGQAGQTWRFDPAGNRLFADPIQETLSPEEERQRWEDLAHKNWDNPDFNLLQPPTQTEPIKAPDSWPDNRIDHDEHWHYRHDRFGNLTEKRGIQNTEENHRYRYDANQRLIRHSHETESGLTVSQYFYDPFGRRLARQTQESDNKGKPTGEIKTAFYGWDGDRLVLTEENGRHIHTIYEPDSFVPLIRIERPATKPNRSLAQKFEQMGAGKVKLTAQDTDLLNRIEPQLRQGRIDKQAAQYLSIAGVTPQMLQELLDPGPAGNDRTIHYYHCDHLGTPIALINEQGQLDWSIELDPWGNVLKEHNPNNLYQPIRFQGQHFDEESGLHYNRHRYYDPKLGRYITQDPIGLRGGIDQYCYVSQNPVNLFDPFGLDPSSSGGPYHPPDGVSTSCTQNDSCSQLNGKMFVLKQMIDSHEGWDRKMPPPRGGGRHAADIENLWRAYAKCQYLYEKNCKGKKITCSNKDSDNQSCPQQTSEESVDLGKAAKNTGEAIGAGVLAYVAFKVVRTIIISVFLTPAAGALSAAAPL